MTIRRTVQLVAFFLFIVFAASALHAGFQYEIPPVTGDPAKLDFLGTEQAQIRAAFAKPSGVMKSWVIGYFRGIERYDDFLALSLHSQIWVVQKVCHLLAVRKDDQARFLTLHFTGPPRPPAEKIVAYK